ncbi:hypothetical protein LOK49_LG15G00957 [Camellia lanceoleosa]|uniref:Uncharacterized protein n=1 Tax=Camellia lanceoleosa TaxID=1840588 RepID=A0ACC0F0K7_9ERIC|nr:hypothetical protein LOK49_LG15G00957 [Camellia lanceoleosa]
MSSSSSSGRQISPDVYNKAVDDLVNVNKLFTLAVFLGLALATTRPHSLANRAECNVGIRVSKRLIVFEVLSFSCFLSSTLVAMAVKLHLNMSRSRGGSLEMQFLCVKHQRERMVFVAGLTSFLAYFFLMLSIVDIIQIRLGKMSCYGAKSLTASVSVVSIISVALLFLLFLMLPPLYTSVSLVRVEAEQKVDPK